MADDQNEILGNSPGGLVQNAVGTIPNIVRTRTPVPAAPKTLALDRMLSDAGLQFVGMDDTSGNPRVLDAKTGQERTLNLQKMASAEGIDLGKVNLRLNTPQTALPQSPVSAGLRAEYATIGDTKSFANRLKQDFDEVVLPTKENGLDGIVVKKNGAYHKVDPGFFEGFSASELGKDLVEMGAGMAGQAFDAASPMLAPTLNAAQNIKKPGSAPMGGTSARMSLGRILGTYSATPTEQLVDEGVELLTNAAGVAIPEGGKVLGSAVIKGLSKLAPGLTGAAREAFTSTVGFLTKAGQQATETMLDKAPQVATKLRDTYRSLGRNGTPEGAKEALASSKAKIAQTMIEEADAALPVQYNKALHNMLHEANDPNLPVNVGGVARAGMDAIEELGLGKIAFEGKKRVLVPLTEAEKVQAGTPEWPEETFKEVGRIFKTLERYEADPVMRGTSGVNRLSALNRAVNAITRQTQTSDSNVVKAAANKVAANVRAAITEHFDNIGLGEHWAKVNEPYIKYGESVQMARDMLNSREGVYTFADKLTRVAGKRGAATDIAKDLVDLLGKRGQQLYDDLLVTNAAMKFAPRAPQLGFAQVAAGGGVALASKVNPILGGAVAAASTVGSMPRTMLGVGQAIHGINDAAASTLLPFARAMRESVGSLAPTDRASLLASPAFAEMARTALEGTQMEEQTKQQLTDWASKNLGSGPGAK